MPFRARRANVEMLSARNYLWHEAAISRFAGSKDITGRKVIISDEGSRSARRGGEERWPSVALKTANSASLRASFPDHPSPHTCCNLIKNAAE